MLDIKGSTTMNIVNTLVEYNTAVTALNNPTALVKFAGLGTLNANNCSFYNASQSSSAALTGLVWMLNTGVTPSGIQNCSFISLDVGLGAVGSPGLFINKTSAPVTGIGNSYSVRFGGAVGTHCIVGAAGAGTATTYTTNTEVAAASFAYKFDTGNLTVTDMQLVIR